MCFSAQASFTAAAVIGTIGVASVIRAKPPLRMLAFTPLIFAFQQAVEGVVWISLEPGGSIGFLNKTSTYTFMILATMFWPLWIPIALYRIEQKPIRKRWLQFSIGIGCLVATFAGIALLVLGRESEVVKHHLNYPHIVSTCTPFPRSSLELLHTLVSIIYLLPTIVSFFISTLRGAWILGGIIAVSWAVSKITFSMTFMSVWCFFAAWASVIIYFIVKK